MINQKSAIWIEAEWPAPKNIRAGTTLRTSGYSKKPFDELNLALHVEDESDCVRKNRNTVIESLHLKSEPNWLDQIHSSKIINLDITSENLNADASYTTKNHNICTIMTADCVPILFCNIEGTQVAAVHAGWKGLSNGIIENSVNALTSPEKLLAWIGPCISSSHYEVGADVYENCINHSASLENGFEIINDDHWNCDLVKITKILLKNCGVGAIYECNLCTYENSDLFYSYRRDGKTGRTASMVWME